VTRLESTLTAVCCLTAIVAGVALLGGLAWALIIGGVLGLVITFLLFDPAAKRHWGRRHTAEQRAAMTASARADKMWNG
jgi:O-antigen/teichoic acid export membrane protein